MDNEEKLARLMSLGFEKHVCEQALRLCDDNVELAASWLFDQGQVEIRNSSQPLTLNPVSVPESHFNPNDLRNILHNIVVGQDKEVKMVFVVRMDLDMSTGKIAAQVAHAAVDLYQLIYSRHSQLLNSWIQNGYKKIVLQGDNQAHLLILQERADELSLPNTIIRDAGRTEVEFGSMTVFAVVGAEEIVNQVTGSLKLLK